MKSIVLVAFISLVVTTGLEYRCPVKFINTDGFVNLGNYCNKNALCTNKSFIQTHLLTDGNTDDCIPYRKTYYLSTLYKEKWYKAKDICELKGMEFLTLDTLDENNYFMQLFNANPTIHSSWVYIGGITTFPKSYNRWYWLDMGKRLSFQPTFAPGEPSGRSGNGIAEYCLSIGKVSGLAYYNDIRCNGFNYNFLCQTRGP